ncbi:Protein dcg1 [Thecaphora frezii]
MVVSDPSNRLRLKRRLRTAICVLPLLDTFCLLCILRLVRSPPRSLSLSPSLSLSLPLPLSPSPSLPLPLSHCLRFASAQPLSPLPLLAPIPLFVAVSRPSLSTATAVSMPSSDDAVTICVLNPNSSRVITEALQQALEPLTPPGVVLNFLTGPPTSPPSINDAPTSILSASECYKHLVSLSPLGELPRHPASAYVVACFSDHPLVAMLRHAAPSKPALHILEAAIIHSLSCGTRFGVLTTDRDMVADVDAGIRKVLGGNSDRYVGTVGTGLGVVELQTGDAEKVHTIIKRGAAEVARRGADVIILGCAGMAGMESLVRQGVKESGLGSNVAVIDGAKAAIQIAAGLARSHYRAPHKPSVSNCFI